MATDAEIRSKFWKALNSDMTMFLGLAEGEDGPELFLRASVTAIDSSDGGSIGCSRPGWVFRLIHCSGLGNPAPREVTRKSSERRISLAAWWSTVNSTARHRITAASPTGARGVAVAA